MIQHTASRCRGPWDRFWRPVPSRVNTTCRAGTIGRWSACVALRECLDVRTFRRRGMGLERQGFLQRRIGRDSAGRIHGSVDVRPVGQRDTRAHGAGGIEFCGTGERADRFGIIEAVHESQSLIEVVLCGRNSSGDAFVMGAEVRIEGNRVRQARRHGLDRRLRGYAGSSTEQQRSRCEPEDARKIHRRSPSSLQCGMRLVGRLGRDGGRCNSIADRSADGRWVSLGTRFQGLIVLESAPLRY